MSSNNKNDKYYSVVKVKKETIAACMTCPLCNKLLRDATTISECLHTFCRKCIHKKLSDEEFECCPICEIDLGCVPLEKLRPDHSLQDVRAKIFPFKRRKVDAPEVVPSVAAPAKRKERSLSSLVVSTPRVSGQTVLSGRRSKVTARKTSRGSSFSTEKLLKKDDDAGENPESSGSRETLTKITQNIRQNSSIGETSNLPGPDKNIENVPDTQEGEEKFDLWKPLNFLVEVANRSKSSKFTSQGSTFKSEPADEPKIEGSSRKAKRKFKINEEKNCSDVSPLESAKAKKSRRIYQKKAVTFGELDLSPQAVLEANSVREGYRRLPQISARFLRIKDGSLSVSFIQKYLMKKLDLPSEEVVEIRCTGQPVVPTLQLHSLVELWLQTVSPPERVSVAIGSSAKDFVMVLGYAGKVTAP